MRKDIQEKYAHYFLAALLLLSEGIDVSLECVDDRISLKRKNSEEYFFSVVDTCAAVSNIRPNKKEELTQTEIMQVVKFFKDNRTKVKEETSSVEEFKKGKFLDTPRFLIQTYIFEFLDTVEDAGKFNKAVYEILCDMVPEEKMQIEESSIEVDDSLLKKRTIERVESFRLSKYFIAVDSVYPSIVYLNEVNEVEFLTTDSQILPFSDSLSLPPMAGFFNCFPSESRYTIFQENPTELLLCGLFCCLLYNPKTEEYSLEKMANASEKLKEIFTGHNDPKDGMYYIISDWNKVTSDLQCNEIKYFHRKNKLDVGMFNFFLVIAEISGTFETHGKKLLDFKKEFEKLYLYSKKSDLEDFYTKMFNYIQDMLKSLCVSDKMQISCRNIYQSTKGIAELFGLIVIKYTDSKGVPHGKDRFIKLKIYEDGVNYAKDPFIYLKTYEDYINYPKKYAYDNFKMRKEDKALLTQIKNRYREKEGCFMHLLLLQYIENRNATANKDEEIFGDKGSMINEIVENDLRDINRVFLLRKLNNKSYKRFVMGCFLTHAAQKEIQIGSESRILRFTSNILGSIPLDENSNQTDFIEVLGFVGYKQSIFSNIQCLSGLENAFEIKLSFLCEIDFMLYTDCKKVLIRALKEHSNYSNISEFLFKKVDEVIKAFDYLFKDNDTKVVNDLFDSYFKEYKKDKMVPYGHAICATWFVLACQRKTEHQKVIQELYDYVDIPELERKKPKSRIISRFFVFYNKNAENVVSRSLQKWKRSYLKEKVVWINFNMFFPFLIELKTSMTNPLLHMTVIVS